MKKNINLLPPSEQRQIALAATNAEVVRFGAWLVASIAILAVLLLAAMAVLQARLRVTADAVAGARTQLQELEQSALRDEVDTLNRDLKNYQVLSGFGGGISESLRELGRIIPPDVTLDSVAVDPVAKRVEISGRSGIRTSSLQFRQNILQSEFFYGVNFPLKNLEKASETTWSYRFYFR